MFLCLLITRSCNGISSIFAIFWSFIAIFVNVYLWFGAKVVSSLVIKLALLFESTNASIVFRLWSLLSTLKVNLTFFVN
nr:hypothetical protein [Ureaplasma urealyticum]